MWIVAIAWMYVAVMMAVAEAFSPQGSVLGAVITLLLYGIAPLALVMYLLGTPARRRARRAAEAAELAQGQRADHTASTVSSGSVAAAPALAQQASADSRPDPDAGRLPASDPLAAERKEP